MLSGVPDVIVIDVAVVVCALASRACRCSWLVVVGGWCCLCSGGAVVFGVPV